MNRHVLIVEDEPKIAQLHIDYLQASNYASSWIDDGNRVIEWVKKHTPDLILLDLMLPGRDGLSLCREIRSFSQVPIIMVTARVEEIDRLLGLEIGANDYICKPFSPREVIARINAIFRLIDSLAKKGLGAQQGLNIRVNSFEAEYDGTPLHLTKVEFKLLVCLSHPPFSAYSRQQLIDRIHDDYRITSDRTIDTHVKNLRKKLQSAGMSATIIESVYGVGYRWNPE